MTLDEFLIEWGDCSEFIRVQTSGSTGVPKPMLVEKKRMEASARITCDFLGLKAGDRALLCMSLDYIAGKMMVVRSLVSGLQLIHVEPSGHPLSTDLGEIDFAAMVPMQVYNSLMVPEERQRLMQIKHLIIGGGSIDEQLAKELKPFPNQIWSTYGMTETLSHIALRRLNGMDASEWYSPFDNVQVSLNEEQCLVIDAPLVCEQSLVTNDIAEIRFNEKGKPFFRILGRKDNVICSGGIKIQIEEVERLLKPVVSAPFLITKKKDEKFGEVVAMLVEQVPDSNATDLVSNVKQICERTLPKYWQPKSFMIVERIPLTETGKPARKKAEELMSLMERK